MLRWMEFASLSADCGCFFLVGCCYKETMLSWGPKLSPQKCRCMLISYRLIPLLLFDSRKTAEKGVVVAGQFGAESTIDGGMYWEDDTV